MATSNDNVTRPTNDQRTAAYWMINDSKGGFQEHTLFSKGGPPQFVSISKSDVRNNHELKALGDDVLKTATIDRQGVINVSCGKILVPFVNVQAQIGRGGNRHTYSHVNVVADKKWLVREICLLSYCWGSAPQPIQLIRSNLVEQTKNIKLTLLPMSIQDAILTIRRLGMRYLWVDALCIIQDSSEDKVKEIEQMDQVYSNSTLTIAAANAASCYLGFRNKRGPLWSDADAAPIELPFLCPDWVVGKISLVIFGVPTRQDPLHCRSWRFQEYILSRRMLMYESEQMLWICQQDSSTGIGATCKNGGPAHDSSVTELKHMRMFLNRPQSISVGFVRRNLWVDLVTQYSAKEQTIPDDKIHALRGIASRYQWQMKDQYISGLWRSWLIPGLVWKRSEDIRMRRKRQYPSWSWLSIDSPVTMERAIADVYRPESIVNVQLVDYYPNVPTGSLNAFGLLPNAILHMRGCLLKIKDPDWKEMRLLNTDPTQIQTRFLNPQPGRVVMDAMETSTPVGISDEPVWCLPAIRVKVADQRVDTYVGCAVQGLLLRKMVDNPDQAVFTRVGWFISSIEEEATFLNGMPQNIFIR
ncbi:MAG: hypothetical protein Q9207_007498 [Kuettlingeria erythrocarpa]